MRTTFTSLIAVAILITAGVAHAQQALFKVGAQRPLADDRGALVYSAEVILAERVLVPGERTTVLLPLPDEVVTVGLTPVAPGALGLKDDVWAWTGRLKDGGDVFVMQLKSGIEARIQRKGRIYRLRTIEGARGVLEIYESGRFREAPGDGVLPQKREKRGDVRPDSSCEDPASRIDVMVLYTPAARDAAGGAQAIENEVAFTIGVTNLAYANSNVFHRLNLVHTGVVSYNEPSAGVDSNALLGDLQATSDGVLDTIHSLRDSVKADLVSLIYEKDDSSWCGWGNLQETANADTTDDEAFSVVQRSCAAGNLSYAHEVGHNLGAKHDRDNSSSGSLDFNFGHIQPVPSSNTVNPWRSVMAYNSPCSDSSATGSCPRVGQFSNPNVNFQGDPTGVALTAAEPEHNVEVFAQNDSHVARYRCLRSGALANVWMKDRWADTGGEPDPATAGQPMWQSPYIWVRLAEDTNLEHEHEHENPVLGQTNHVYMKLHNDGAASQSGNVELYFASASTNLNNPANWTQIGTQAKTLASAVEVVHFQWTNLPGAGHYCLLGRWNEDGTPLAFTNLGAAVRNDNDLIWRNVNIQDLGGDPDTSNQFQMAGHREFRETYLMIETLPMSRRKIAWQRLAAMTLAVDKAVLDERRLVTVGLIPAGNGQFSVPLTGKPKLLGPVILPPGKQTTVKLHIKANQSAVKAVGAELANDAHFEVSASQISPLALQFIDQGRPALFEKEGRVIGGVSYILRVPAGQ